MNRCRSRSWTVANAGTGLPVSGSRSVIRSFDTPAPRAPAVAATSMRYSPMRGAGMGTNGMPQSGHFPAALDLRSGCIGHQYASARIRVADDFDRDPVARVETARRRPVCLTGIAPCARRISIARGRSGDMNATWSRDDARNSAAIRARAVPPAGAGSPCSRIHSTAPLKTASGDAALQLGAVSAIEQHVFARQCARRRQGRAAARASPETSRRRGASPPTGRRRGSAGGGTGERASSGGSRSPGACHDADTTNAASVTARTARRIMSAIITTRFTGFRQVPQGSTGFGFAGFRGVPQGSGFSAAYNEEMLTHRRSLALITVLALVAIAPARPTASPQSEAWIDPYREPAARLVGEALSGSFAWERLAELGDTFGHRLSGSQSLEDAIQWAVQQMKKDGLENVHTEPVKVPHWVRGQESAEIVAPRRHAMVDARPRQQRRHARRRRRRRHPRRPQLRAARRGRRSRAGQGTHRAVTTSRSRTTARRSSSAEPARRVPRRAARSRRSSGPSVRRGCACRTPAR